MRKKEPGRRYSVSKNTEKGRSTEFWGPATAPIRWMLGPGVVGGRWLKMSSEVKSCKVLDAELSLHQVPGRSLSRAGL